jgi:hypothetical protein
VGVARHPRQGLQQVHQEDRLIIIIITTTIAIITTHQTTNNFAFDKYERVYCCSVEVEVEVEAEVEVEVEAAIRSWNSFWTSSSFCVIRFMTFFITIGT